MFFDCFNADLQDFGDLFVKMPLGDESDHLGFAFGEFFFDFWLVGRRGNGLEQGRYAVAVGFFHILGRV